MQKKYTSELYTLMASLLWGSSFIAIKLGLAHLDPWWFVQWRLLLASLILLFSFLNKKQLFSYLANKNVWVLGILNACAYLFQFIGMQYITASAAAFYVNFGIVFTAILSFLMLKEYFGKVKLFGLFLALVGVFLLSTNGNLDSIIFHSMVGDSLVLISGFFWALYLVSTKKILINKKIHVFPLTTMVLFLSALFLVLPALLWGIWPEEIDLKSGGILSYTVIFCTVVPFLLWTKGLRGISATVSAAVLLTEPIFAVIIAYPILGEVFEILEAIGAFLILTAIGLISFTEEKIPHSR